MKHANRAREIFIRATEITGDEDRREFVDDACGGDDALRKRVHDLLQAHDRPDSFFAKPAVGPPAELGSERPPGATAATIDMTPVAEQPGTVIGLYKLREKIGEGGFGTVYVAEQTEPVRRKVALKIIKPGMDTREVIARFEAERQALAMMEHPNVAKVLDAGTTGEPEASVSAFTEKPSSNPAAHAARSPAVGRPYFVMELVKGVPITDFCDERKLSTRERLPLFVQVCRAVQHAHQKGIIHRDLKPSNVMVTLHDGVSVPKVIDFGVSKALSAKLTEKTVYTAYGQMVGTPMYMSPEQAQLSADDVDTRSDIYSLGVLLYELLTGTTPFDKETLQKSGFDEMRRIIREEEPPRPSARLSTLNAQVLTTVSESRRIDSKRLAQSLRGELDWIVMKALEKDRNRRYETANGLARDIERHLNDEPVQARPPSMVYRLRKLARRNKTALLTAALVFIALWVGSALSIWQALRAANEANRATEAEQLAKRRLQQVDRQRHRAEGNLQRALDAVDGMVQRVSDDLREVPGTHQIREALLQDALDFYQQLPEDPNLLENERTDPALRHRAARAYMQVGVISEELGHAAQAKEGWRRAITILEKLSADFPAVPQYRDDLARSYSNLGHRALMSGRPKKDLEARSKRLVLLERLAADFPTVPSYHRRLAGAHTDISHALRALNRFDEAEKHARLGVTLRQKVAADFPNPDKDTDGLAHARQWLGAVLLEANKWEQAEDQFRQSLALREKIAAQHPNSSSAQHNIAHISAYLGEVLRRQGKPQQAEPFNRRAVTIRENLVSDFPNFYGHSRRLKAEYAGLRRTLIAMGRTHEAETVLRRDLSFRQKLLADFPGTVSAADLAWAHYDLGVLLHATGRTREAAEHFRQAMDGFEEHVSEAPEAVRGKWYLAWLLATCPAVQFRDAPRAIKLVKKTLQHTPGAPEYWETLGMAQHLAGDAAAAIHALEQAKKFSDAGDAAEVWFLLAMAYWQAGRQDEARTWYDRAAVWMDDHQPKNFQLGLFRAEAERFMGISNQRSADGNQKSGVSDQKKNDPPTPVAAPKPNEN